MIHPNDRLPYLAAFGFRRKAEVDAVLAKLPRARRLFAIGLTVTPASLVETPPPESPYAGLDELRAILPNAPQDARVLYLVRYETARSGKNEAGIGMRLVELQKQIGRAGLQLAGITPTSQEVGLFLRLSNLDQASLRFVMEMPPTDITAAGVAGSRLLGAHVHARTLSDVCLAYPAEVDVEGAHALLREMRSHYQHQIGYTLAGGLTAETVDDLGDLVTPDLSLEMTWGARGSARAPGDTGRFDPQRVVDFFHAAATLD